MLDNIRSFIHSFILSPTYVAIYIKHGLSICSGQEMGMCWGEARSCPRKLTVYATNGHTDSTHCGLGLGLQDSPWWQRKSPESRAGWVPASVPDGCAGQSKGGGVLGGVTHMQKAGDRKQYRAQEDQELLLTEHKGRRLWGIKHEHLED